MNTPTGRLSTPLRRLYRITSVLWTLYALGLANAAYGSVLLGAADPGRTVVAAMAALVAVGMLVRAVLPDRPKWTQWTLPLMAGTSVAAFLLTLFAIDATGGLSNARAGFALLILVPGAFAFVHYVGERVVVSR